MRFEPGGSLTQTLHFSGFATIVPVARPTDAPVTVSMPVPAPVITADWVAAIAVPTYVFDASQPADCIEANKPPLTGPRAEMPTTAPTPVNASAPAAAPPAV